MHFSILIYLQKEIFPILAYVEQINLHFLSVILVIKTCLLIVLLMRSGNHN